jgi:hypothetical protein
MIVGVHITGGTEMVYKIRTKVKNLEFKKTVISAKADRSDPMNPIITYRHEDVGWFAQFEGSYEALFVGKDEPHDLSVGTNVIIYIVPEK